jgi:small-conductance mechanosensitive channel
VNEFFSQQFEFGSSKLTIGSLALFLLAILISWAFGKIFSIVLYRALKNRKVENGKAFAITQILRYILYAIFFVFSLQILNLNLSGLLLGASALLIGVGIGLQQIFYDLFSGLLMLIERKVKVGDFVDIDGMVGRVDKIDMRTSVVRNIDNISVIVPNSKLISENVTNWSSNRGLARFKVVVRVVYGSDVEKVKTLLIECAKQHEKVLNKPMPMVQFKEFGESSMNFHLLFWSVHFREIDIIKSDLHFAINDSFIAHKIQIAYPQLDVHLKRDS